MKDVMANGCQIKNALKFCTQDGLLKRLEKVEKELKVCEKALNEFLDSKRRAFPRFYFVSVNDLLDILSNGNSPAKINRHMSKIFQAIEKLTLKESSVAQERPSALEMVSCVGQETVKFTKELKLEGKVEVYLKYVIETMIESLRSIAESSFQAFESMEKRAWIARDPAQVTILVNMIRWVAAVEDSFTKLGSGDINALKSFLQTSITGLTDLIKMVQGQLDRPMRQKVMCLITLDAHSRDVIIRLIDESVRKPDEF
jgi:dynein heavy chain